MPELCRGDCSGEKWILLIEIKNSDELQKRMTGLKGEIVICYFCALIPLFINSFTTPNIIAEKSCLNSLLSE